LGPGVKYHVITIAAIFLALAVGLIIGGLFLSPQLVTQQKQAIKELRDKVNQMDAEDVEALKHHQEFVAQVLPTLVRDKLNGANVCIIQTGDYPDAVKKVRDALTLAGAKVVSVTSVGPGFDRTDDSLTTDLISLNSSDSRVPTTRTGLADMLARILAEGDTPENGLIPVLDRAHLLVADEASDYTAPSRYAVIVAGSRSEDSTHAANVDSPLIAALLKHRMEVVGCEPSSVVSSDLDVYDTLRVGIPTVPDVDTDIGACALIYALRGDRMFYGVRNPVPADSQPR
jgi:hypothetical protein